MNAKLDGFHRSKEDRESEAILFQARHKIVQRLPSMQDFVISSKEEALLLKDVLSFDGVAENIKET